MANEDTTRLFDLLEELSEIAMQHKDNPEAMEKALGLKSKKSQDKPKDEVKSLFIDPYAFYSTSAGLWRERPSMINFETLRQIAERNPIISAIINTRINQVASFSSPVRYAEITGNSPIGYKIVHKQEDKKLSSGEQKFVMDLEEWIWHCGQPDPKAIYDRDNYDQWLRKIVRDSLTFDGTATELVPTRDGSVYEFHAIDTATTRIAVVRQDVDNEEEDTQFVQVLNGQIVTRYSADEMLYGVRNPTTNVRNNGYGVSEIEQIITVITNIFNAMTHNAMFFRNGAAVKGILNIKPSATGAGVGQDQLEAFKRAMYAQSTGSVNAWKMPITQAEAIEFINMSATNREMEFARYFDFLVKMACGSYLIDPSEINFYMSSGSGQGNSMFESRQEERLKASKDKGLRPLLNAVSRWMNTFVMARRAPDFYFTFVGIDSKDESEIIDLRTKEVGSYKQLDEIRQEAGLDPIGEEKGGDLILNPTYVTAMQQRAMMAMQQQGMEQDGEEGQGGPPEEADQNGPEGDQKRSDFYQQGQPEEEEGNDWSQYLQPNEEEEKKPVKKSMSDSNADISSAKMSIDEVQRLWDGSRQTREKISEIVTNSKYGHIHLPTDATWENLSNHMRLMAVHAMDSLGHQFEHLEKLPKNFEEQNNDSKDLKKEKPFEKSLTDNKFIRIVIED